MAKSGDGDGFWVRVVRFAVPSLMVLGGIITAAALQNDIGVGIAIVLVGGGLLVAASAWVIRLGLSSNVDREREEQARREFSRRGVWRKPPE